MSKYKSLYNEYGSNFDTSVVSDLTVTDSLTISDVTLDWDQYDGTSIIFNNNKLSVGTINADNLGDLASIAFRQTAAPHKTTINNVSPGQESTISIDRKSTRLNSSH